MHVHPKNWSVSDEQAEEDNESTSVVAESSLDRLACGLGGKTVLPHINATLTQMLTSDQWKCRHAALMAISAVGEGCHKQMEAMLPQVGSMHTQLFKHKLSTLGLIIMWLQNL